MFGLETSITTLVCLAEMLSWEELGPEQRGVSGLGGLYGAYLGVGECYRNFNFSLNFELGGDVDVDVDGGG